MGRQLVRRSATNWGEAYIELGSLVVEEGNTHRLRKLTKDGDANAVVYVDQCVMNVLTWQKERQGAERERLGSAWTDHDLVFARDGFKLYRGEAGGPQDSDKVSARWRTLRTRLKLPEEFRIHDWRPQQGHERSGVRGEPCRGLRERSAPLAGLHHGPLRPLT